MVILIDALASGFFPLHHNIKYTGHTIVIIVYNTV